MFTGLVQDIGSVESVEGGAEGARVGAVARARGEEHELSALAGDPDRVGHRARHRERVAVDLVPARAYFAPGDGAVVIAVQIHQCIEIAQRDVPMAVDLRRLRG